MFRIDIRKGACLISAGLLLATASGVALAQDSGAAAVDGRTKQVFSRLDSNGDGGVSRTEAQFKRQQRFARLDRNADGTLNMDEYMAPLDRRFTALDANGDGSISPDELAAGIAKVDRAGME